MPRAKIDPKLKKTRLYISTELSNILKFPTPTHARIYAQNAINNFNPSTHATPKITNLDNFNANLALQNFIKARK